MIVEETHTTPIMDCYWVRAVPKVEGLRFKRCRRHLRTASVGPGSVGC